MKMKMKKRRWRRRRWRRSTKTTTKEKTVSFENKQQNICFDLPSFDFPQFKPTKQTKTKLNSMQTKT